MAKFQIFKISGNFCFIISLSWGDLQKISEMFTTDGPRKKDGELAALTSCCKSTTISTFSKVSMAFGKCSVGKFAHIGPTHLRLQSCKFIDEFDTANTNMKVLFVIYKYISRYKHFCVALKSH